MLSIAVILCAVVLVVLGALQVHWSREVSDAARARIGTTLKAAMLDWHLDLLREFSAPAIALSTAIDAHEPITHYLEEYDEWTRGAAHPEIVADVFVVQHAPGKPQLVRLDLANDEVMPASWPPQLEHLHELLQNPSQLPRISQASSALPHGMPPRADAPNQWVFDPHVPALIHAAGCGATSVSRTARPANCVIIVFDRKQLERVVLPELAQRYFGGGDELEYQVALIGDTGKNSVVYSSDKDFDQEDFGDADARMDVFGPHRPAPNGDPQRQPKIQPEATMSSIQKGSWRDFAAPVWFDVIRYVPGERDWYLLIKPRRGSLEDIVASSRRRDLSISFGVLVLLAVTLLMVIITSHRAQNLARMQMEFISAVSHELRTPLAVMCSAADNLADGVVQGPQQLSQYRSIISSQAQQLTQLMEQVLAFAATGDHRKQYEMRPLQVSEIIEATLEKTAGLIHDSQFEVKQDIEPGLPPVLGDLSALSQCLQNLVVNAVKYSGQSRWIGIRACASEIAGRREVEIRVEDRGIGIRKSDLSRIFEPFYRSPLVIGSPIHGTGLGLSLASSIAEAMNGRLTVSSTPGEGSIFTLHLPAVPAATVQKQPEDASLPVSRS